MGIFVVLLCSVSIKRYPRYLKTGVPKRCRGCCPNQHHDNMVRWASLIRQKPDNGIVPTGPDDLHVSSVHNRESYPKWVFITGVKHELILARDIVESWSYPKRPVLWNRIDCLLEYQI